MMREKSRARRRVRTRVARFLSLASLAGLYLIRLLGAALNEVIEGRVENHPAALLAWARKQKR